MSDKPNYQLLLNGFERLVAIKNKIPDEESILKAKIKAERVIVNKRRRFIASCFPPVK